MLEAYSIGIALPKSVVAGRDKLILRARAPSPARVRSPVIAIRHCNVFRARDGEGFLRRAGPKSDRRVGFDD